MMMDTGEVSERRGGWIGYATDLSENLMTRVTLKYVVNVSIQGYIKDLLMCNRNINVSSHAISLH